MTAWSHLPNAKHIDFILESLKAHTDIWATTHLQPLDPLLRQPARIEVWNMVCFENQEPYNEAYDVAWPSARDAILALIAYDDCAYMLDMDYEELKTYALLSENPAAILMLPAVKALQLIKNIS